MNTYIDNSCEYAAQVDLWSKKLTELMLEHDNAAESVLAYYLPVHSEFLTCPLGVDEFKRIGEEMRENAAVFAAAENTGLIAKAVEKLFGFALDNHGSWCAMVKDVRYMLEHPQLGRYIHFEDRYLAERLLHADLAQGDDEDFWCDYYDIVMRKFKNRKLTGFAYT